MQKQLLISYPGSIPTFQPAFCSILRKPSGSRFFNPFDACGFGKTGELVIKSSSSIIKRHGLLPPANLLVQLDPLRPGVAGKSLVKARSFSFLNSPVLEI